MKLLLLFPLMALAFALPSAAADSPNAGIDTLITTFQASLKKHDTKALEDLFLPGSDVWIVTLGDKTLESIRAKDPAAPRYKVGTRKSFLEFVGSTKSPIEEDFHNVRIHTDGSMASVYFDFEFMADGKVQNRGAETWQLVHTDDGWKIAAMLYSSNF